LHILGTVQAEITVTRGLLVPQEYVFTSIKTPRNIVRSTEEGEIEMKILETLTDAVLTGKQKEIEGLVQKAVDEGLQPLEIVQQGLIPAMEELGKKFKTKELFIPEVLLSAVVMKKAMNILKPLFVSDELTKRAVIVIGTVKGDLHDVGKNLVIIMLEGAGYQVVDLGMDVPANTFLQKIKEENPQVFGMSAMLTTTMMAMKDVIDLLNKEKTRESLKIIVGGAPLNADFAQQIGADAYAEDAAEGLEIVRRWTT
jgi:5-methyltetrahydrofolate--homocysteine methyltransferase